MTWLMAFVLGVAGALGLLSIILSVRLEEANRRAESLQRRNRKIRLDRHDDRLRWERRLRDLRVIVDTRHEKTVAMMLDNFITIQRRKNAMMAELVQYIAEQRSGRVTMSLSSDTVEFVKAIRAQTQQENTPHGR